MATGASSSQSRLNDVTRDIEREPDPCAGGADPNNEGIVSKSGQ